ncbi:MAG: hypothetical protein VXZ96_06035 [Myxococcota bacterium]|nr:hypothetical protein [Myxococcota bacterium]
MRQPILMGYRPSYPSWRAQDIQVLHAAHSLSELGHPVTLLANRTDPKINGKAVLKSYGLLDTEHLDFRLSPSTHLGISGLWFRQSTIQWWMRHKGTVIVRDLNRFKQLQAWLPNKQRIIIEAHQLPSIQASDLGLNPSSLFQIEQKMLQHAWGLIANCGGVMDLWLSQHPNHCPTHRMVIHNGTAPSRLLTSQKTENIIRCLGSLRPEKGLQKLLPVLKESPLPIEFVGASPDEMAAFGNLPAHITVRPPVPYPEVPKLLATATGLLLPLENNRFGRSLTSPLKLWDYMATDRPILAPNLPSIREIQSQTNRHMLYYEPDEPIDLLAHLETPFPKREKPFLRSWSKRARELSGFLSR